MTHPITSHAEPNAARRDTGDLRSRTLAFAGRVLPVLTRGLLGLLFLVCGLDGFLHFIPMPTEPMPERAMAFGGALMQAGYFLPLLKGTELLAGVLLVTNRFVPLALVLLAPVVVNIAAFHAFLTPGDVGMAFVILIAEAYLAWSYRAAYRPLFVARAKPGAR